MTRRPGAALGVGGLRVGGLAAAAIRLLRCIRCGSAVWFCCLSCLLIYSEGGR